MRYLYDICRELGEQRGAGGNAKCWGGSPFAGGKMLNAWGGPDTHGGGGFKMTLVLGSATQSGKDFAAN